MKFFLAILLAATAISSCQKDQLKNAPEVLSSQYTALTLNDLSDLPNPAATEQYAARLFDLNDDGTLTEKELQSVGDPTSDEDLVYALLFVEAYDREDILWSWQEPQEENDGGNDRSNIAKWKWTGGNPIVSMYASGFKKWPAYKVKNRFQDPCGEVIKAGPVYEPCYKLCDGNLPPPCMSDKIKKDIVTKIIADTPVDPYSIASQLIAEAGWPTLANVDIPTTSVTLMNYERQVISGNIVHYKFEVAVGSDPHDKIGIHRVVKEAAPYQPIITDKALFYQHGDAKDFVGMTLPGLYSATTPNDFGIAVYMAQNDVDFWGIDQAWTLVPADETDFGFMKDWGLGKNTTDLRTAMAVARIARFLTSDVLDKMDMAGYSSGVTTGYAVLNHETTLEEVVRHAKGYIAIDLGIKSDNEEYNNVLIGELLSNQDAWNNGSYESFIGFSLIGNLAKTDPDGDSPIVPGFTNEQTALYFGTYQQYGVIPFHFLAGVFENNFPVGLQFLTNEQWYDFAESAATYEPTKYFVDYYTLMTDYADSPFDDHFADISVPVLNFSPGGGFGDLSTFGLSYFPNAEMESVIAKLYPDDQAALDFGHIDSFIATNAKTVAWQPMLNWVNAH